MRRLGTAFRLSTGAVMLLLAWEGLGISVRGAVVSGRAQMTDLCSPSVSPAVVYLEPVDSGHAAGLTPKAESPSPRSTATPRETGLVVVNLQGLQCEPRVRAITLGQTVRYVNRDEAAHHLRLVTPGDELDARIPPGRSHDFTPRHAGPLKLACGTHLHMRGFVIVSPTPWYQVCSVEGDFRIEGIPPGRYILTVWHEMGDAHRQEITLRDGDSLKLPRIVLSVDMALGTLVRKEIQTSTPVAAPIRPWNDVLDRISVLLAAALDVVSKPGDYRKGVRMVEDAYWGEFEASEMESAVRLYLSPTRSMMLAQYFGDVRRSMREVGETRLAPSSLADLNRKLLLALVDATRELNGKGVVDNSRLGPGRSTPPAGTLDSNASEATDTRAMEALALRLQALKRGLHRTQYHADRNVPEEAVADLIKVSLADFHPLKNGLRAYVPQSIRPLEEELNLVSGDVTSGVNGDQLASRIETFAAEIERVLSELRSRPAGAASPDLVASLYTVLAGGVEPVLLLTALLMLVIRNRAASKSSLGAEPASAKATETDAGSLAWTVKPIGFGAALGAAFGVMTGFVLKDVSARGTGGGVPETVMGWATVAASAVCYYVGIRLFSRVDEARSSGQTRMPVGTPVLSLTAGLTVYRGLTATSFGFGVILDSRLRNNTSLLGLLTGLAVGLGLLVLLCVLVRSVTAGIPGRGLNRFVATILLAMAIVFGGKGIFELQTIGIVGTDPLNWLGRGIPILGVHPSQQVLAVQGLLLTAVLIFWVRGLPRGGGHADEAPETSPSFLEASTVSNSLTNTGR